MVQLWWAVQRNPCLGSLGSQAIRTDLTWALLVSLDLNGGKIIRTLRVKTAHPVDLRLILARHNLWSLLDLHKWIHINERSQAVSL